MGILRILMARILVLTSAISSPANLAVLPALSLLQHDIRILPAESSILIDAPESDCIILDARKELPQMKALARLMTSTGLTSPLIVAVTEGGLSAISSEWGTHDVILDTAGPAEIEARIRITIGRFKDHAMSLDQSLREIRTGEVVIDETAYTAKIRGRSLDLTFKEFELLKFLAQHPGRVFTRAQLLQEIWGYDYFGGTRTVDVHIRRLRSKLGPEFEAIIGTVRNVGYRFTISGSPRDAFVNESV